MSPEMKQALHDVASNPLRSICEALCIVSFLIIPVFFLVAFAS